MIPRFKPYLNKEELLAVCRHSQDSVERFEMEFARVFRAKYAISFPYGRSALWAFFNAMDIQDSEVIMPAYTCSVVAHAIVLSGNTPRFVDITLYDYNMDLAQVADAISERTHAIVATHLFGHPLNVDLLSEIVHQAESRYGHRIWVIQDCAHSFGARWNGKSVCGERDCALFGLNISKTITSIFGGMMTTNDDFIARRLSAWRGSHFTRPGAGKSLRRLLYLLAVYAAFSEQLYGLVDWLQERTPVLDRMTKAYHLDEKIHFPPDYLDQLLAIEARVGSVQLHKYPEIIRQRYEIVQYYNEQLSQCPHLVLPPLLEDATYSHYAIRVPNRDQIEKRLKRMGIQLGRVIDYSIPHLSSYIRFIKGQEYPNALISSQHLVNLPLFAGLKKEAQERVVACLKKAMET